MNMSIVRFAQEDDASQIAEMIYQWSRWQRERVYTIREAIRDTDQEVLVAELDGRIVGVLQQAFFPDILHGGYNCHVLFLLVEERHRGMGIGSQLLNRAIDNARKRDVLEIHVDTIYEDAAKFYRKRGFKDDGVMLELALEGNKGKG